MAVLIRDLDAKVFKTINKLRNPRRAYRLAHVFGPSMPLQICEWLNDNKVEELHDLVRIFQDIRPQDDAEDNLAWTHELAGWAYEEIEAKEEGKRADKQKRYGQKTENRALYLHEHTLDRYIYDDGQDPIRRWTFNTDLRSAGLMRLAVRHKYGEQATPVCVSVVNALPLDDESKRQLDILPSTMDDMNCKGLAISAGSLAWNLNSPGWTWGTQIFPNAIDFAGYNHGLNAPLLPHGFLPEIQITLKAILHPETGEDLETDGSGLYHPDTPELQPFIGLYGLVPFQFRYINDKGLFTKGVLFPSEHSVDKKGGAVITCDWIQVKGRWNKHFADGKWTKWASIQRQNRVEARATGYLGIIGVWNKPGWLTACFELIENIIDNEQMKAILFDSVLAGYKNLRRGGIDGLFAQVSRDDDRMKVLNQFLLAIKLEGLQVEPTQIQMVRAAIEEKLGRILWDIANGAAIKFPRYVCRMDKTIPRGYISVSGIQYNVDVACFRFPLVLAQGATTLNNIKPQPHLMCRGEVIPFQAAFNPLDLVTRMQGDDDGDIAGISPNPAMVELFNNLNDNRVYHIEPEGELKWIPIYSAQGLKYIQEDRRGDVGRTTIYRSRLLAIGDLMGGNGLSIGIQENIDCAKKFIVWSDVIAAMDVGNWTMDGQEELHFDMRFTSEQVGPDNLFPLKLVQSVVKARCKFIGGTSPKNVLGWKWDGKKIDPKEWCTTFARTGWNGGNLVHKVHDFAHDEWRKFEKEFKIDAEEMHLEDILPLLLRRKGIDIEIPELTWREYSKTIRTNSGLNAFGQTLKKARSKNIKPERKFEIIDQATATLHTQLRTCTMQDIATIWVMECTLGNTNNAFRVVTWVGSPVLELLGIDHEVGCQFLTPVGIKKAVEICLRSDQPYTELARNVHSATKHTHYTDGAVHLWECPECTETLQTALVRTIREQKRRKEHDFIKSMTTQLNTHR